MKIKPVTEIEYPKALALLRNVFPGSSYETRLFENLHSKNRDIYEWVCIIRNKAIGYLAYTNAYHGKNVCGLHLGPVAILPEMQNQGIGSELIRFSLRQKAVKDKPLFVLGEPRFYQKFGFERCLNPKCPFDRNNKHFLSMRNSSTTEFEIGYEPEFHLGA